MSSHLTWSVRRRRSPLPQQEASRHMKSRRTAPPFPPQICWWVMLFLQLWKTSVLRSSQVVVVMIRKAFLITKVIRCQHKNTFELFGMLSGLCSIVITLLEPEEHKSPPPSGFTDGHHWTMSIRPASARPDGASEIPMIRDGPNPAPAFCPSVHTGQGCQY